MSGRAGGRVGGYRGMCVQAREPGEWASVVTDERVQMMHGCVQRIQVHQRCLSVCAWVHGRVWVGVLYVFVYVPP